MNRALIGMSLTAVACLASGGTTVWASQVRPQAAHARASTRLHSATQSDPWLYVSGYNNGVVEIYDLATFNTKIGVITTGLMNPAGLTLDAQGTLYVANSPHTGGGNVTIYPAGATSPSLTLSQGLDQPTDVVVDNVGNVYVTNRSSSSPGIVVFPPGQTVPSETITSSLITNPISAFMDAAQTLYVSDFNMGVSTIPFSSTTVTSLGLNGLHHPQGIILDPTSGDLIVNDNVAGNKYVTQMFAPGSVNPSGKLKQASFTINDMASGSIGANQFIFLPNGRKNMVKAYENGSAKPSTTIKTGAQGINGIAFKPAGTP